MPTAKHEAISDDIRERASLYQLGLLDQAEAGVFEHHLADCDVCRREVRELGDVVTELAFALPESRPGARVREELMRRTAPASVLMRAGEGDWQASGFEGVDVKQLFADPLTGNVTSLVRMQPGAKYPPHRHAGNEHCYVLQGNLVFVDHTLSAGDYEVSPPSTDHAVVTTSLGCLLLITNNVSDQVFAL
jgi:anti-sigma factor ChrR (cupin superfamily)